MNPTRPAPPPNDLATLFTVPAPEAVQALVARADHFRLAIARGGCRADYLRWQASLDALQAAADIAAPLYPHP